MTKHLGNLDISHDLTVGRTLKLPGLTTVGRDALTASEGDRIYNSDNGRFEWFDGAGWGPESLAGTVTPISADPAPAAESIRYLATYGADADFTLPSYTALPAGALIELVNLDGSIITIIPEAGESLNGVADQTYLANSKDSRYSIEYDGADWTVTRSSIGGGETIALGRMELRDENVLTAFGLGSFNDISIAAAAGVAAVVPFTDVVIADGMVANISGWVDADSAAQAIDGINDLMSFTVNDGGSYIARFRMPNSDNSTVQSGDAPRPAIFVNGDLVTMISSSNAGGSAGADMSANIRLDLVSGDMVQLGFVIQGGQVEGWDLYASSASGTTAAYAGAGSSTMAYFELEKAVRTVNVDPSLMATDPLHYLSIFDSSISQPAVGAVMPFDTAPDTAIGITMVGGVASIAQGGLYQVTSTINETTGNEQTTGQMRVNGVAAGPAIAAQHKVDAVNTGVIRIAPTASIILDLVAGDTIDVVNLDSDPLGVANLSLIVQQLPSRTVDFTDPAFVSRLIFNDEPNEFTGQQVSTEVALVDAANIVWDLNVAQAATVTLEADRILDDPTNMIAGGSYVLRVVQGATVDAGGKDFTYGAAYKWPGGVAPALSDAVGDVDLLTFYSDGVSMFGVVQKDFQ